MIFKNSQLKSVRILGQLIIIAALFCVGNSIAQAATITVNALSDNASGGNCELRDAINAANNNAAADSCTAGSGTDTIVFSGTGTVTLTSDLPTITQSLTIDGDTDIILNGNNLYRILNVSIGTGTLGVQEIELINGADASGACIYISPGATVNITSTSFDNCNAVDDGGAIYGEDGGGSQTTFNLVNVTMDNGSSNGFGGGAGIYVGNNNVLHATNLNAFGNVTNTGDGSVVYADSYSGTPLITIDGGTIENNSTKDNGAIFISRATGHTIDGVTFQGNQCGDPVTVCFGAAVTLGSGAVLITNSNFVGNETEASGGTGYAGAVAAFGGTVNIEDSIFDTNTAYYGGAIYVSNSSTLTVQRSTFIDNVAGPGGGGAIIIDSGGGNVDINASTFINNSTGVTAVGGAIKMDAGTLDVTNSTFEGNDADYGGAIITNGGTNTIYNNTFTNNTATTSGGGLYISNNATSWANNILEGNTAPAGPNCIRDAIGDSASLGTNLIAVATGCPTIGSDITGSSANLGALQLNGGTTLNRLPTGGSLAIDAANATYAPAFDQIGVARFLGSADDIGSMEVGGDLVDPILAQVTPVPTPTNDTTPNYTFSTDEAGTISYGGDCSSATTSASVGNNTITFNALAPGAHTNCTITVTDASFNASLPLAVNSFTIDTTAPTLAQVTPVPTPTNDSTPNYTFSSNEAGTISYGGDCSSATTSASSGNNTVTFNTLAPGLHNNCTVTVTDAAGNASSPLSVSAFTIFAPTPPRGRIIFQNDDFATINSDSLVLNSDDEGFGDLIIQFGTTIGETLTWNSANSRFNLSSTLDLGSNQLTSFRTENATSLPGGAPGLGGGGTGRMIMLTSTDSIAPGCTVTACIAGIYAWSGSTWLPLFKGEPGGNTNDVQYNTGTAFGGEDAFEYDASTNQLSAPGVSITEDTVLTGDISPAQLTANQNDYNPTGLSTAAVIRLSANTSHPTITGLAGGTDGRTIILHNIGDNSINLSNQNSASTAANRFDFGDNDLILFGHNTLTLRYNATTSRWNAKNAKTFTIPSARRGVYHFHDMLNTTTDSAISSQVVTGTNSATAVTSLAAHPGVVRHSTGASSVGSAAMLSVVPDSIILGNSWYWYFDEMIRITTLSTAAQTYVYRAGFIDSATGEPVDGVYFRYTHGVNSGRWELVCRAANTETATASTSTVAISVWYRLTIIVNPAGSSAEFFVNGTSIGTCASNIPTASGTGFGSSIVKTVGTTARTIDLDYLEIASYSNVVN